MNRNRLLHLFFLCCLESCTYGYSSYTDIAYQEAYTFKPHTRFVEVFFEDTKPVKAYRQIGLIEIDGAAHHTNDALLVKIRKRAQEMGADAVIGVRKSTTTRSQGSLVGDILFGDGKDDNSYVASVFTGIAIKYEEEIKP